VRFARGVQWTAVQLVGGDGGGDGGGCFGLQSRLLSSHTYANGLDREPNVGIEYRWSEGRTER